MKRITALFLSLLLIVLSMSFLISCEDQKPSDNGGGGGGTTQQDDDEDEDDDNEGETQSNTFNVVFNFNYYGAENTEIKKVAKGGTISASEAPTAPLRTDGYSFAGWYSDKLCTVAYNFSSAINDNLVLFAKWSSSVATVSFNYNYVGGPEVTRISVPIGGTVQTPQEPIRSHYSFDGWFENSAGTGNAFDFSKAISAGLTLFAKWTLVEAEVVFNCNVTDATSVPSTAIVAIGSKITRPADPQRTEYNLDKWLNSEGNEYDFGTNITESMAVNGVITLTASWTKKKFTVTYDWNGYDAGMPKSEIVEYGNTATEPTAQRTGFFCLWKIGENDYLFSTPVTSNITLKAEWTAEGGQSDTHTVKFMWNYDEAPNNGVYQTMDIADKRRITSMPTAPVRDGYMFDGWFTESACTTVFPTDTSIREDVTLYARWLKKYTFEAEYVDLTGVVGAGYSNEASELQMIKKDITGTCQASNGYYISSMFVNGSSISFNIVSDKATDNAKITMRVQAEFTSIVIDSDTYKVEVNGQKVYYDELEIEVPDGDVSRNERRPFFDYDLGENVHLNEGNNVIKLTTNNTQDFDAMGLHFGTLSAYAPMVDLLYVYSDTVLTWSPKTGNIPAWEAANN